MSDFDVMRSIKDFKSLVRYLRTELDWPIDEANVEQLAFDYSPAELGIDEQAAVNIEDIKQIKPLVYGQPWGIFYVEFESKNLPVVVLRRILRGLIRQTRGGNSNHPVWDMEDLLFISSQGELNKRSISFGHFRQQPGRIPELRTFSWDSRETHLYYIKNLNLGALRWPGDVANVELWRTQWRQAFIVPHRYVPNTAKALAEEMARLAMDIRDTVLDIYQVEHADGPLHQLYLSFRTTLISDLAPEDFADMYAQTVTYGLFASRATQHGEFAIDDVAAMIPVTNPFLQELLSQVIDQEVVDLRELGVLQLADLFGQVNLEAILMDFGKQKRGEDPVIHFYETFMAHYDKSQKIKRGEFYTPNPVVSFIVRSVDLVLRSEFDCLDGLANTEMMDWQGKKVPKIQILDPAAGTGTFLQYVIMAIWEAFQKKNKKIDRDVLKVKWNRYVADHLLPRLYGFELKMAPYTIAHMKLALKLGELGYEFGENERLRVFLTNSLQPLQEVPRTELAALAHEANAAGIVKTEAPIMVVLGNPPYAGHSSNTNKRPDGTLNYIGKLLRDYYMVDGKPLGEKNPKWLQDD